jgi:3-oxoacyl-[acyl-carrier-protein] synthase-3
MSETPIRLVAAGTALPGSPVATATLARHWGLAADEERRIADALGIHTRHLCRDLDGGPPHTTLADLATTAAERALTGTSVAREDIGAIVMSTATPDRLMPATVNIVADRLGIDQVPTYQLQAGATGSLQAVEVAARLLAAGRAHTVLVLAGDVSTKLLDVAPDPGAEPGRLDAASCGDGAAAAVLTSRDRPGSYELRRVTVRRGNAGRPPGHTADWLGAAGRDSGRRVLTYDRDLIAGLVPAVAGEVLADLLDHLGWEVDDLARLLPPQLPGGLAGATAQHVGVGAERRTSRVEEVGHVVNPLPLFQLAHACDDTVPGDRVAGVAVDPSDWSAAGFALQRV